MRCIDAAHSYICRSLRGLSVCRCVGHIDGPCKTAGPIDMPFGTDLYMGKETIIRYGCTLMQVANTIDRHAVVMRPNVKLLLPLVVISSGLEKQSLSVTEKLELESCIRWHKTEIVEIR